MTASSARRLGSVLATVALTALVVPSGCGDGGGAATTAAPATTGETATVDSTTADDLERYCDLQRELDVAVDEAFRQLGEGVTPEDAEAALREFAQANDAKIRELERAAPAQIRDDVALLATDVRVRAGIGDEPPVALAEVQAAERRVAEFEDEAGCPG